MNNSYKIWDTPKAHARAFKNAAGDAPIAAPVSPCSLLMAKYHGLHTELSSVGMTATRAAAINQEMKTILNEMHNSGCGQSYQHSASFTGGCGGATITDTTQNVNTNSTCAGGVYRAWCAGAFQPYVGSSAYVSGNTCVWNNPTAAICAMSAASSQQMSPVCCGTSTNVMNTQPVPQGNSSTSPICCVPAASICNLGTPATAATAPIAVKVSAPYIKPTFLQWLRNGMKA